MEKRRRAENHIAVADPHPLPEHFGVEGDVAMQTDSALGRASGARRIDELGNILGAHGDACGRVRGLGGERGQEVSPCVRGEHAFDLRCRDQVAMLVAISSQRHQGARAGIAQMIVELLGFEHRIEGHQYRAALPGAQLGHREFGIVLRDHGHAVALAGAVTRQPRGKARRAIVQLRKTDRLIEVVDGGRVRPRGRCAFEQVDHTELGQRQLLWNPTRVAVQPRSKGHLAMIG